MQSWNAMLLGAARPVAPLLRLVASTTTRACIVAAPTCAAIHVALADDSSVALVNPQQITGGGPKHGVGSSVGRCFSTSHASFSGMPDWLSPQLATGVEQVKL
jgi:hypothetical protein